jgi:hypothetical protein
MKPSIERARRVEARNVFPSRQECFLNQVLRYVGIARKMDQQPINRRMESPNEFGARLTIAREDALRKRLIEPLGHQLYPRWLLYLD